MADPISQDQLDGVGRSRPVDFSRAEPPYSVLTGALSLPGGAAHTTHLANSRGTAAYVAGGTGPYALRVCYIAE